MAVECAVEWQSSGLSHDGSCWCTGMNDSALRSWECTGVRESALGCVRVHRDEGTGMEESSLMYENAHDYNKHEFGVLQGWNI